MRTKKQIRTLAITSVSLIPLMAVTLLCEEPHSNIVVQSAIQLSRGPDPSTARTNLNEQPRPARTNSLPELKPRRRPERTDRAVIPAPNERQIPMTFPQGIPGHVPHSILKKYDVNKNGIMEPQEWYQYRKDMEQRRVEVTKLRGTTNFPASAISTNKPANP